MKILIGSDGVDLNSKIAKRFGHANYYLVYDTETETLNAYQNEEEEHDHKILEKFLNEGVTVFIVGNIGPHAFERINGSSNKVYLARLMTVKDAIEKYKNNQLELLTAPTVKKSIGHKH